MIKLTFCVRRAPDLSLEEFRRYWYESHGPLVRSHGETLAIKRYVQVHADLGPLSEGLRAARGAPEPFDGIAEAWFESREAFLAAGTSKAGRAAARELMEDEGRFVDFERSPIWIGEEKEVIGP